MFEHQKAGGGTGRMCCATRFLPPCMQTGSLPMKSPMIWFGVFQSWYLMYYSVIPKRHKAGP